MQKLDSKKIENSLKQLENAAKGAIRALNEMTENSYKDSDLEKQPLKNVGLITMILHQAQSQVTANAKYEGMDEDQVAEAQAAEREAEKEALQKAVQEKLAKRQPKEVEPATEELECEPTGDETPTV